MITAYTEIQGSFEQQEKFSKRIKQPVDRIVHDVLEVIGLVGLPVLFHINLKRTRKDISDLHEQQHGVALDSPAYTSKNTIHVASEEVSSRILAHEVAHAAINCYFTDPIPIALHELIAQTVEERVCEKYSWFHW